MVVIMFGWVCGFRVKGMGNFQKFRVSNISGYCGTSVQNSQKFLAGKKGAVPVPRAFWHGVYRTHRSSSYGSACPAELTNVLVPVLKSYRICRSSSYCGTGVQSIQKFRVRV